MKIVGAKKSELEAAAPRKTGDTAGKEIDSNPIQSFYHSIFIHSLIPNPGRDARLVEHIKKVFLIPTGM